MAHFELKKSFVIHYAHCNVNGLTDDYDQHNIDEH